MVIFHSYVCLPEGRGEEEKGKENKTTRTRTRTPTQQQRRRRQKITTKNQDKSIIIMSYNLI